MSITSLREGLARLVPGYMLPARWMRYDVLPKNDNGKIDRPRLRNQFAGAEPRPGLPQVEDAHTPEFAPRTDRMVRPASEQHQRGTANGKS